MPRLLHLTPMEAPVCGVQPDGRSLPCSGVTGRTAVLCYPSRVDCRLHSNVKSIVFDYSSVKAQFVCEARWNPDSPRKKRLGVPQNRNRQKGGKDNFQNLEGNDTLSSQNGKLLSPPETHTFQATSAPGQKENKEIIELFRKVQAQLREHAAVREDKENKGSKKQGTDSGTVESLLNVLRKHTVDKSKRSHGRGRGRNFLEKPKEKSPHHIGESSNFVDSDSFEKDEPEEAKSNSVRPASKFQKRSPVPRVKFQPIPSFGDEYADDSISPDTASKKIGKNLDRTTHKSDDDAGQAAYANLETDAEFAFEEPELEDDIFLNEDKDNDLLQHEYLSKLKVQELRAMAKSRGLKGTSKMKKNDLVALLSSSSSV